MILVGASASARADGAAVLSLAAKAAAELGAVKDGWNGFCVLHSAASRVGALDLGFVPGQGGLTARQMAAFGTLDVLFLMGADEIDIAPGAFVVYIGTHGDRDARGRRAAGGCLSGKVGDLCQHRRPGADGDACCLPAGRCA
jgi:NADH-quinone oxidoreductase subunit G